MPVNHLCKMQYNILENNMVVMIVNNIDIVKKRITYY